MPDSERRGRQASVDGFAHEHIVVGILMKKYQNVSLLIFAKVIGIILSPWQLRGSDAGQKQPFGAFKLLSRLVKIVPEIINIFWDTISYRAFHVIPRILIGVKIRSISGEVVGMNTPVGFDEPLNRSGFVNGASVPDKNKAPLEIFKKVPQKGPDLGMPDILGDMKTDVKTDSLFLGRDADGRDRRDLGPSAGDFKNRGLAAWRPGFPDRGDKQKPALVEEDKGDVKPLGLFLYAAIDSVSIVLPSSHPVLGLVSQASGSSNPSLGGLSRHERGDTERRSAYQSPRRFSSESKARWSSPASRAPRPESLRENVSGAWLVSQADPAPVLVSTPYHLFSYKNHSSSTPNLTNNRALGLYPADSLLYPRAPRPADVAFRALFGFHGVAWNQFIVFLLLMQ